MDNKASFVLGFIVGALVQFYTITEIVKVIVPIFGGK